MRWDCFADLPDSSFYQLYGSFILILVFVKVPKQRFPRQENQSQLILSLLVYLHYETHMITITNKDENICHMWVPCDL
jgi:hypothetical protein